MPIDYRAHTILITGASAGLGTEFARQLAARGANVVLVARRLDRLDALADELTAAHGIRATAVALDLSAEGAAGTLVSELDSRGLAVTGLINNAGFGYDGAFHTQDPARVHAMIALNIVTLVDLTRALLPRLREAKGILINIASVAAYQPLAELAAYSASKSFVLNFTEALWYESRGSGLCVLALSPGETSTEFFDTLGDGTAGSRRGLQTPDQPVTTALRALDRRTPPPSIVSGGKNRTLAIAAGAFPRRVALLVGGRTTSGRY